MHENTYEEIIKAQKGDEEAMASLINNNIGLVYNIARRFYDRGYEKEDLNQIGTMGLIKSIRKFDINYDVKLSTYAVPFIIGEIKRYIRDDGKVKVSRSIKELAQKIGQLQREYIQKEGKDIKIEEIAQILKVSKEDIAIAIDATSSSSVVSINEKVSDNSGKEMDLEDVLKDKKDEMQEITNKLTVEKLLKELKERERKILILRYYKGNTQCQVAKMLGISQVQVSRIEKKILSSMREKMIS